MPTGWDDTVLFAQAGTLDEGDVWSFLFVAAAFATVVLVARLARNNRRGPPILP